MAVFVGHAGGGTPAEHIAVDVDADDLVGRKKTVVDALAQGKGIGVERLAEVVAAGNLLGFLRRGGEADVGRAAEVVEDGAPVGILVSATAVALIDDDQVGEIGREPFVDIVLVCVAGAAWYSER